MTTPTQVPDELISGDTWEWTRDLGDYPASAWTAAWFFENATKTFSVAAAAAGSVHTATVAAATTSGYPAGDYRRFLRLTRIADGVVKTPETEIGWVTVRPNPAAAGNVDHRTVARRNLQMIQAYLADETNLTASSYSLGGRSLSRWSRAELREEYDYWRKRVQSEMNAERQASGRGTDRRMTVRFKR